MTVETWADRIFGVRIGPPGRGGWRNRSWRWIWLDILNRWESRRWNIGKKRR